MRRAHPAARLVLVVALAACACGSGEPAAPAGAPAPGGSPAAAAPADLDQGLVLALAQFVQRDGKPVPGPARLEFLAFRGGRWQMSALEDPESNVFHKALAYRAEGGARLLSLGGTAAIVKLWQKTESGLVATPIWRKDFGGKFSRMRDAEVGDIYGDGRATIAVATHDQGVVAMLRPKPDGGFEAVEVDHEPDTFVHEIELGDLDGDSVLEVYATPSEPNRWTGPPRPAASCATCRRRGRAASRWPSWAGATRRRSWSRTSMATAATSSTSRSRASWEAKAASS